MEPGGIFAKINGEPCPVATLMKLDGTNGGIAAGRACWAVVSNQNNGTNIVCRNNRKSCFTCEFYYRVNNEEEFVTNNISLAR
jgi:hypothetical protein